MKFIDLETLDSKNLGHNKKILSKPLKRIAFYLVYYSNGLDNHL